MTPSLKLDTTARDLTLNLNDSCNCCCYKAKKLSPKTQVYVRENGEVLIFDSYKAGNAKEAMARCVSNLERIMNNMEKSTSKEKKEALDQLKKRVISTDESPQSPITLEMIEEVLQIQNST